MIKKLCCTASLLAASAAGAADGDFGTLEEARTLARAVIEIANDGGLEAVRAAMQDPRQPFVSSRMGINLFQTHFVVADNREPEMVASDYAQIADLTGIPVWPRISAAAERQEDVVLKWYHYDTQEHYDFHCYAMKADRDDLSVMVCR